ncbi:MAG TPA: glycosyltransferase family 39 protein, partial [Solirubrobacteraceae bacterium]
MGAAQGEDRHAVRARRHARRARLSRPTVVAAAALLLIALAVRLLAVAATPHYAPGPGKDDRDYDRHACWVALHGVPPARLPPFPAGPGSCAATAAAAAHRGLATAYRPPLWPVVLGGAYALDPAHRWTAGRLLGAAIGTVAVGLTGAIAAEVWGAGVGLAALALAAVFLPLVLDGMSLISEPLFVIFELAAALCVLRHRRARTLRWAVAAGVLVGLASLTRSTGPVLALALLAGLWPRWRAMAAFAAAAVLVVAPWTIRNAHVLHAFVPISTETGVTLLGTYNDAARTLPGCAGCWVLLREHPQTRPLARRIRVLDELGRERLADRQVRSFLARHPLYPLRVAWGNTLRLLELGGAKRTRFGATTIDVPPRAAIWAARELWLVCALALIGLAAGLWRRRPRLAGARRRPAPEAPVAAPRGRPPAPTAGASLRRAPGWLVALPVVLWLFTALVQSETPRFRAPLDPFLLIAAALGLAALSRAAAPKRAAAG